MADRASKKLISGKYPENYREGTVPLDADDPPATPDRAANDRIVLELIDERDRAETMADELAATIGAMLGVDLGEHTSGNDPWQNALDAAAQRRP